MSTHSLPINIDVFLVWKASEPSKVLGTSPSLSDRGGGQSDPPHMGWNQRGDRYDRSFQKLHGGSGGHKEARVSEAVLHAEEISEPITTRILLYHARQEASNPLEEDESRSTALRLGKTDTHASNLRAQLGLMRSQSLL